jgi:acetyl esterase/lipase
VYSIPSDKQINDSILEEFYRKGWNSLETSATFIRKDSILNTDDEMREKMTKLFDDEVSPSFADDLILKEFPPTFIIVCNNDPLRDEGLIYAERMMNLGVNIDYDLYDCKHRSQQGESHLLKNRAFLNMFIQALSL